MRRRMLTNQDSAINIELAPSQSTNQGETQQSIVPRQEQPMRTNMLHQYQQLVHGQVTLQRKAQFIVQLYKRVKYSVKSLKKDCGLPQSTVSLKPQEGNKRLLLLDLDQTLLHYTQVDGHPTTILRPHCEEVLSALDYFYMIYAYTSASKAYGSAAVAKINRTKVLLQGLLSREHCFETRKGKVIKNLLIVANWHLKDIIIVDNLVTSFALQLNNGIPILDFLGDPADQELLTLKDLLIEAHAAEDVRTFLKERLGLQKVGSVSKTLVLAYKYEMGLSR